MQKTVEKGEERGSRGRERKQIGTDREEGTGKVKQAGECRRKQ